jgi:hypothetical protein
MTLCASITNFLARSDAVRIRDWLVEEVEDCSEGHLAMMWLAENRLHIRNRVLCYLYDVACYQVQGSCFAEQSPADEQDKWFISVLAESEWADQPPLMLKPTLDEAEALAVESFGLVAKFFETAEVSA